MPMKAALEMSSKSEFGLMKWYQLKVHKNFKKHYINTHSHNLNLDLVSYFPFKLYSIVS